MICNQVKRNGNEGPHKLAAGMRSCRILLRAGRVGRVVCFGRLGGRVVRVCRIGHSVGALATLRQRTQEFVWRDIRRGFNAAILGRARALVCPLLLRPAAKPSSSRGGKTDRARFLPMYIKEAHPNDEWQMNVNEQHSVCYPQPRNAEAELQNETLRVSPRRCRGLARKTVSGINREEQREYEVASERNTSARAVILVRLVR